MTTNKHSIIIKFNKNDPSIEDANIQHLPFNLLYNGFAKVSNYLKVNEKQSHNNNKTQLYSQFRGVKLVGENLELPQGFNGYIFRDENQDAIYDNDNSSINNNESTSVNKQWEAISKFNNLIYWNRETIPSDFDKPVQALKSLNILSIINKEITAEEIQNEINSNKVNNKGSSNTTTTSTSTTNSSPTKTTTTTTITTTTSSTTNPDSPTTTPTKSKIVTIQKSNSDLVEDMDFDLDDEIDNNDENEEENKRKQKKLKKQ